MAGATAAYLARDRRPVTYLVTGDDGRAEEDVACAEYLTALLDGGDSDPAPYLRRAGRSDLARRLAQGALDGYPGIHPDDVTYCLDVDRYDFTMVATRNGSDLRLRAIR